MNDLPLYCIRIYTIIDSVEQFTRTLFLLSGSPDPTSRNRVTNGWLHFFFYYLFINEPWQL